VDWLEARRPAKARAFTDHYWNALAGIQEAGRIAEALSGNLDFVGSALEVDSEASSVLNEVQDAIVALVESAAQLRSVRSALDPLACSLRGLPRTLPSLQRPGCRPKVHVLEEHRTPAPGGPR
jgi:hypothetical protein